MKHLQIVLRCVLLALLAGALVAPVSAEPRTPLPSIVKGEGDQCVEPTDVMRRDHMEFLRHQRDDTVHAGIRTKQHSLKGCIECHAVKDDQGKYVPAHSPERTCPDRP